MLTKQFYQFFQIAFDYQGVGSSGRWYNKISITGIDGAKYTMNNLGLSSADGSLLSAMNRYGNFGVRFGSDDTPPTQDDFKMGSLVTSITVTTPSTYVVNEQDDYIEYISTFGVTATSDTTIAEIGLQGQGNVNATPRYFLLDHTLLDEPITLRAGESTQITYTIRINYIQ